MKSLLAGANLVTSTLAHIPKIGFRSNSPQKLPWIGLHVVLHLPPPGKPLARQEALPGHLARCSGH